MHWWSAPINPVAFRHYVFWLSAYRRTFHPSTGNLKPDLDYIMDHPGNIERFKNITIAKFPTNFLTLNYHAPTDNTRSSRIGGLSLWAWVHEDTQSTVVLRLSEIDHIWDFISGAKSCIGRDLDWRCGNEPDGRPCFIRIAARYTDGNNEIREGDEP
jgi:hypothetical protein